VQHSVFISYRRIDTNWAAVSLRNHIGRTLAGLRVFMDIESIEPGEDFVEAINRSVDQCQVMLVVIGPNWLTVSDNFGQRRLDNANDFVRLEIIRALEKGIRLIPLLVDVAGMPPENVLPKPLRPLSRKNAVTINHHSHARDFDVITDALKKVFPESASKPETQNALHLANDKPLPRPHASAGQDVAQALLDAGVDGKTMCTVAQQRGGVGRYDLSADIYKAAADLLAKSEGPLDNWTLAARHNHARAIQNQGNAAEAEQMFHDLLPLMEKANGPEHPDTLATRYALAHAIQDQGSAAKAEQMLRDLLPLEEKVNGPEHDHTLATRHELARAILDQGQAAKPEQMFRDLLPLREKVNGPEHPDTLTTRHMLARAILDQGHAAKAEQMFRYLLPLMEKVKGPEHNHTLATHLALATALLEQGQFDDARKVMENALGVDAAPPIRQAKHKMLQGWLADQAGDAAMADGVLDQANALLSDVTAGNYTRRQLAKYLETRVPGGVGGTIRWMDGKQ
jgi:tetratricopeptide (TPR) repeat protein